jgi:hypothetical protein
MVLKSILNPLNNKVAILLKPSNRSNCHKLSPTLEIKSVKIRIKENFRNGRKVYKIEVNID